MFQRQSQAKLGQNRDLCNLKSSLRRVRLRSYDRSRKAPPGRPSCGRTRTGREDAVEVVCISPGNESVGKRGRAIEDPPEARRPRGRGPRLSGPASLRAGQRGADSWPDPARRGSSASAYQTLGFLLASPQTSSDSYILCVEQAAGHRHCHASSPREALASRVRPLNPVTDLGEQFGVSAAQA
ncbi:hypothetical protein P7K49_000611 [Saguinus oedipus]|uniref:Uncharacterized protein n=1 Tax=Saguinus oedipus TaxID=9490 RepID=A0ABQ9WC34_SAGOE|nr:hypothetical protein P7K49_000611 [Saguinus oedipus]